MASNLPQKATRSVTPQCKVVLYLWETQTLYSKKSLGELSKAKAIDISSRITMVEYQKTMGAAAGTFTIVLGNSASLEFQDDDKEDVLNAGPQAKPGGGDWKDIVKRGTWCTIYMSQAGDLDLKPTLQPPNVRTKAEGPNLRCIGFIDRVSARTETGPNGALDVTFELQGRDFGVIYDDTVIWHNLFKYDKNLLEAAQSRLRPTTQFSISSAIKVVHDLFFNPAGLGFKVSDDESLTSITRQWLLPRPLVTDLGLNLSGISSPFWGALKEPVEGIKDTTMGFISASITDFLSGQAWSQLNSIAVREFHELFTEIDAEGIPRLNFRPIPWAIDKTKYSKAGVNITLYKDVPATVIPAVDFISTNVGEDNHNRYNSFLVTCNSTLINTEDNISILRGEFPLHFDSSIQRHGFKPMHVVIPALSNNEQLQNGISDTNLLIEYNHVLTDYWQYAVFAESGTFELIGNPKVKLGTCIEPDAGTPYISGRRYYVEGYSDVFTVGENGATEWVQSVQVTRGIENSDLTARANFSDRDRKFQNTGEFTKKG